MLHAMFEIMSYWLHANSGSLRPLSLDFPRVNLPRFPSSPCGDLCLFCTTVVTDGNVFLCIVQVVFSRVRQCSRMLHLFGVQVVLPMLSSLEYYSLFLNDEGENIVETAMIFDLAIVNTFFEKKVNQYVTYNSGGRESQIDFWMCRRCHLKEMINCKVINGEAVAAQHRLLVMDWEIQRGKKRKPEQATPRIKWWRLKEDDPKVKFREKVLDKVRPVESVQEWWEETSTTILRVGQEVLGMTTGRRPPGDRETWWWNDKVQEVIKAKKVAKKIWDASRSQEDKDRYRQANKAAKKAVATTKALAMNELYEELETPEGERKIFRMNGN